MSLCFILTSGDCFSLPVTTQSARRFAKDYSDFSQEAFAAVQQNFKRPPLESHPVLIEKAYNDHVRSKAIPMGATVSVVQAAIPAIAVAVETELLPLLAKSKLQAMGMTPGLRWLGRGAGTLFNILAMCADDLAVRLPFFWDWWRNGSASKHRDGIVELTRKRRSAAKPTEKN
jgi:hypothetical protein